MPDNKCRFVGKRVKLGELIEASTLRNKGASCQTVYSVTNSQGFVLSADYFNKEVEQARSMLTDSMNIVDLWRTMLRLQHCLDGHSGMDYIDLKHSFPLVYGGASYLYPDSVTDNEIFMNGMKVISINGMEAHKIIHELDNVYGQKKTRSCDYVI